MADTLCAILGILGGRLAARRRLAFAVAGVSVLLLESPTAHATTAGDLWESWTFSPSSSAADTGLWRPPVAMWRPGSSYLYGVHAALLCDWPNRRSKLVFFRNEMMVFDVTPGAAANSTFVDLDGTGNPVWTPNGHQPFCGAYVALGDTLLIVGNDLDALWPPPLCNGDPITAGWASLFYAAAAHGVSGPNDFSDFWFTAGPNNTWGQLPIDSGCWSQCTPPPPGGQVYSYSRYYPTVCLLPDRKVLLVSGDTWTDCNGNCHNDWPDDIPAGEFAQQTTWLEYDPSQNSWQVENQPGGFHNPWGGPMADYPHVKVLPFGLFWSGNDDMNDTHYDSSLWTPLERWGSTTPPPTTLTNTKKRNRNRASCVVMTLDAASSDIRILMVGGGRDSTPAHGTQGAEMITYRRDAQGGMSAVGNGWTYTGQMLSDDGRRLGNAVLLPTGQVLEIGGEGTVTQQNRTCELYTPDAGTGEWRRAASIDRNRGNHSTAVLLPDGRVVSAGWEEEGGAANTDSTYQIYYPPYLFTAGGEWASRPTIEATSTADTLYYGLPFEITVGGAASNITEVCLMRPGAPTHGCDFSQARILLSHTTVTGENSTLIVSGPRDSTYAPPANYLLVVLDHGVPSVGRWVKVQGGGTYAVQNGQSVRWGGDVWLDRDFVVQAGGTLTILPGTTVHADSDHVNVGRQATKVEIINRGMLAVEGSPSARVTFESTHGSSGDWGGILFDLAASPSGDGYTCSSYIHNADVRDGTAGIAIRQTGAPSLEGVAFDRIAGNRDVVLDSTDVYVPYHGVWNLVAPTTVKAAAATRSGADIGGRYAGKVDLINQGALNTSGSSGSWVKFEPDSVPPPGVTIDGDAWGGILFDWMDSTSTMSNADVGYAMAPIYLVDQGKGTTIQNSRVHHFQEQGIFWEGGAATLQGNSVFRDTTGTASLDIKSGNDGMVIETTGGGRVEGNTIRLSGMQNDGGGAGIRILNAKTYCDPYAAADTVTVNANTVLGLGATASTGKWSGIRTIWRCTPTVLTNNTVNHWNDASFEFQETIRGQVTGNTTDSSLVAVNFFRDSSLAGGPVRLRNNCLKIGDYTTQPPPLPHQASIRLDNALQLAVGPDSSAGGTGQNGLVARGPTNLMYENDSNSADTLNARGNYWERAGVALTSSASVIKAQIKYEDHTDSTNVQVKVSGWLYGLIGCQTAQGGGGEALAGRQEAVLDEEHSTTAPVLKTSLEVTSRRGGAGPEVRFSLAETAPEARLEVFDVTGRRVRTLVDESLASGRYGLSWAGEDDAGKRVGSGVYFIRLTGKDVSLVRKLVLVR